MFRTRILPWLVFVIYRLWTWTWRVQVVETELVKAATQAREPLIWAHWHGDELALVHLVRRYRLATMTSTSKDGQLIGSVIRRLGGATSKGSSTRGGVQALKGLLRLMRGGHPASIAVDGPKGPLHRVKPGVFELSRLSLAPIVPVGVACSSAIVFRKSWNQAFLPKPFARVAIYFGDAHPALSRAENPKDTALQQELKERLTSASQQAQQVLARATGEC